MAATFLEPGCDATGGLQLWSLTANNVVADTTSSRTGSYNLKCTSGASGEIALVKRADVLADAGRRINFGVNFVDAPTGDTLDWVQLETGSDNIIFLRITSGMVLQFINPDTLAQYGSNGATLSTGTWYRLCITYTITNTTTNQFRLYVDGALSISLSNVTLPRVGTNTFTIGWGRSGNGNSKVLRLDDFYIDDSSALTDTGDIRLTSKRPAAENTNNFDTAIGNGRGSTDYNNVNEVPLSETNGWQHAAATDVQENYGLQDAATGDVNISGKTLIARTAWLWAKRSTGGAITHGGNGAEASAANGNLTLNAPASPQVGDIWIACVHSSDQVSHSMDAAWTQIVQGNGGGTTSRLSVWWFRYAGSSPDMTLTHASGQSPIGGIVSLRGCKASGSPVNVAGSINGGTDESIEHTAITPTVENCALLVINGSADDNARTALEGDYAIAFEDSGGGTQNAYVTTAGNPDGSIACFYDLSVPASDTGTIAVTQAATDAWASVLIALEPAEDPGSADIMDNGSETAITLTVTSALYTKITDSASYPSNAAGIGIRSTASTADTFLYECGTIIAYLETAAVAVIARPIQKLARMLRGMGR